MSELDKATGRLNDALIVAESTIREMKLGVRARVGLVGDVGDLVFGKSDNQWRLIHARDGYEQPLINAPRNIRIASAMALKALVDEMRMSVFVETGLVEAATKSVRDFITEHTHG